MTEIIRMKATNGGGAELIRFEDIVFPNVCGLCPKKGLNSVEEVLYRSNDILMCSFPKSGLHWMNKMLWKLKTKDAAAQPHDTVIEVEPPGAFDSQVDPRIMCTHLRPRRFSHSVIENKGKIVLMLRNPKDVAVSYYFHHKNAAVVNNKQTWDEFFQSFIQGEVMFGSYFEYLREWEQVLKSINEGENNLQVEVFYYEDFHLKPKQNIARLNEFLSFGRDEEYLEWVLNETTFNAMTEHYKINPDKFIHPALRDDEGKCMIFRKGRIGDWKNYFTVTQSETIDTMIQETLLHRIIDFTLEV